MKEKYIMKNTKYKFQTKESSLSHDFKDDDDIDEIKKLPISELKKLKKICINLRSTARRKHNKDIIVSSPKAMWPLEPYFPPIPEEDPEKKIIIIKPSQIAQLLHSINVVINDKMKQRKNL